MKAKTKATPKAKTPKVNANNKKSLTRPASAALTISRLKKPTPLDAIIKQADADYAAQGGESNSKESAFSTNRAIGMMEALGLVREENGTVEVIGKVVPLK